MNIKENLFQYILGISALFVAAIAAFFSIAGIGMLFSGAYISTVIMATSLEAGKIVATSFLYRYWKKIANWLRVYLCVAVFVLMAITSMGIFGWLTSAYQASAIEYEISQQRTTALVEQRKLVQTQADLAKQRIDLMLSIRTDQEKRLNEALGNPVLSRNPTALRQVQEQNIDLIKRTDADLTEEKKKYSDTVTELSNADKQILESKVQTGKTKDIITFKFVADALGLDMQTTVKWFIIVIIVVFDPLALSLILAYNIVLYGDKKDGPLPLKPIEVLPVPTIPVEIAVPTSVITPVVEEVAVPTSVITPVVEEVKYEAAVLAPEIPVPPAPAPDVPPPVEVAIVQSAPADPTPPPAKVDIKTILPEPPRQLPYMRPSEVYNAPTR
jgi:hypothetical protein